jgi:hypothetical protein
MFRGYKRKNETFLLIQNNFSPKKKLRLKSELFAIYATLFLTTNLKPSP